MGCFPSVRATCLGLPANQLMYGVEGIKISVGICVSHVLVTGGSAAHLPRPEIMCNNHASLLAKTYYCLKIK